MTRGRDSGSLLDATVVTLGPLEPGVEHVGWSRDGGGGPHLIIMRNFSDPDGYCLVTIGGTFYGGVAGFAVADNETRLVVSPEAAHALGTSTELVLRDALRVADPLELRALLGRLLGMAPTDE